MKISNIVAEVFKDRVEAHKHLVTANKEIERLNNIINEIYTKALDTSITSLDLRDYIINNLGGDKE